MNVHYVFWIYISLYVLSLIFYSLNRCLVHEKCLILLKFSLWMPFLVWIMFHLPYIWIHLQTQGYRHVSPIFVHTFIFTAVIILNAVFVWSYISWLIYSHKLFVSTYSNTVKKIVLPSLDSVWSTGEAHLFPLWLCVSGHFLWSHWSVCSLPHLPSLFYLYGMS